MNLTSAMTTMRFSREDIDRIRPPVGIDEEQAMALWSFCEGWHPERFPVAFAVLEPRDAAAAVELLMEIRNYLAERRDFEQRVGKLQ